MINLPELGLASAVQDVEHARLVANTHLLAVRILEDRVVVLHKAAGPEAPGEGCLATPPLPSINSLYSCIILQQPKSFFFLIWSAKCVKRKEKLTYGKRVVLFFIEL